MIKFWVIFLLTFTLDVKVRASEYFDDPKGCLEELSYCLVKNHKTKKVHVSSGADELSLDYDATLVRHIPGEFTIIQGSVLVYTKTGLNINTPYGKIEVQPETTALVTRSDKSTSLTVMAGKALLHPLGQDHTVEVLAGYENKMTAVKNLKAQVEIPKPALIENTLKDWSRLTWHSKEDFLLAVDDFKVAHRNASQQLSLLSREIAMREVETHNRKVMEQQKKQELEKERGRTLQRKNTKRLLLIESDE
jgi:ActR/RegA family two-component response regulator